MTIRPHKKNTAARIGGLALHAFGDSAAIAARARTGFDARFVAQALEVDPALKGEALRRKVEMLRRLHFTRLAAKSARARARRSRSERKGKQ